MRTSITYTRHKWQNPPLMGAREEFLTIPLYNYDYD